MGNYSFLTPASNVNGNAPFLYDTEYSRGLQIIGLPDNDLSTAGREIYRKRKYTELTWDEVKLPANVAC